MAAPQPNDEPRDATETIARFQRLRQERRFRRIYIRPELLFALMTRGAAHGIAQRCVEHGLPQTAELVQSDYDWRVGAFVLTAADESFDPVPDGAIIPRVDNPPTFARLMPGEVVP